VDGDGNLAGEAFPEQTAFLEWGHSDFGDGVGEDRTCQDCHMPDAEGAVVISTVPGGLEARSPFAQHHFVGGNVLMLRMHRDQLDDLEMAADAEHFEATTARTLMQLQEDTATVSILNAVQQGDTLTVDVQVENKAGHKYPTGFPSRRTWLHLSVTDVGDETVFDSGAPQTDGRIAGNDADHDISTYEPHYTTVTSGDQVQIYQSIMRNTDGEVTHTLLRAAGYLKDNRLLPSGFDKQTAAADFATVGNALADTDFVGGSDQTRYEIDVRGRPGPFEVTVELLYQSVAVPFVEDIRPAGTALADRFVGYYDEADKTPILIAAAGVSVP
jgi:hypothetical protein